MGKRLAVGNLVFETKDGETFAVRAVCENTESSAGCEKLFNGLRDAHRKIFGKNVELYTWVTFSELKTDFTIMPLSKEEWKALADFIARQEWDENDVYGGLEEIRFYTKYFTENHQAERYRKANMKGD